MKLINSLLIVLFAQAAIAMPNPTYTSLMEAKNVGDYIAENLDVIVTTSAALAEKAAPNAHYFLVTDKIMINVPNALSKDIVEGKKAVATLFMSSGNLKCERDIFTKAEYGVHGEQTSQEYFLKDEIRCKKPQ